MEDRADFMPKLPTNSTEREAMLLLERGGVDVYRRGAPDFMCLWGGRVVFVEVKRDGQRPTDEQEEYMRTLEFHGIPCFVWTPSGGFSRVGNAQGETVECDAPLPPSMDGAARLRLVGSVA